MAKHRARVPGARATPVIQVNLVNAEAWTVGPGDCLIVNVGAESGATPEERQDFGSEIVKVLNSMGLEGRALVITADDVQLAVVLREEVPS